MKRARKALAGYTADYGCKPDEETYALLAGGWSRAGKIRESADVVLSLAQRGFDPTLIKLNDLVSDWNNGKWRQVLSPSLCTHSHTHTHMHTHMHTHTCTHASMDSGARFPSSSSEAV